MARNRAGSKGPENPTENGDCAGCNVVHVNFTKRRVQSAPSDEAPLSSTEIAGIRQVFKRCPLARDILEGSM